jgi:hypothetical protein
VFGKIDNGTPEAPDQMWFWFNQIPKAKVVNSDSCHEYSPEGCEKLDVGQQSATSNIQMTK